MLSITLFFAASPASLLNSNSPFDPLERFDVRFYNIFGSGTLSFVCGCLWVPAPLFGPAPSSLCPVMDPMDPRDYILSLRSRSFWLRLMISSSLPFFSNVESEDWD